MTAPAGEAQPRGLGSPWPIAIFILALACFQTGGSFGKMLFPAIGAAGAAALRMSLSAMLLLVIARPWRLRLDRRSGMTLLLYGVALAGLNGCYYQALQTLPLGVTVTIDFLGPLGVAVAHTRRAVDALWALLALVGILLLMPWPGSAVVLDFRGLLWSFGSALSWAAYILAGRRAALGIPGPQATALGITVAALILLPFGVAQAGSALLSPATVALGFAVAVLSSALPYNLELFALGRMPTRLFGILTSLEPAIAALFGRMILGEELTTRQMLAIILVIGASAGAAATA